MHFFQTTNYLERNAIMDTYCELKEIIIGIKCLVQLLKKYYSQLAADIHISTYLKTLIIFTLNKLENYLKKTN